MSTVFVHVGQAGCQLAQTLWPTLATERPNSPDIFQLSGKAGRAPRARAVLVDGEPKVIEAALQANLQPNRDFNFDEASAVWSQSGRGGNFALGYVGESLEAPKLLGDAMECVRRQVEACHGTHTGTMLFHSLGGGTGSGLGTRLAVEIRDEFPGAPLMLTSVLPLAAGENPSQTLNVSLALSAIQEVADGIILYENDRLLALATEFQRRGSSSVASGGAKAAGRSTDSWGSGPVTSLPAMNGVIARDLAPFLCPGPPSEPLDLFEVLNSTCPMPTHNFVQAFSGDASAAHGPPSEPKAAVEGLNRSIRTGLAGTSRSSAGGVLSAQAMIRGATTPDVTSLRADVMDKLGGPVAWRSVEHLDLRQHAAPLRSAPKSARAAALVNWKRTGQVIQSVNDIAQQKFQNRVFLHWYEQCGFGEAEFEHAFESLHRVVEDYASS